jgi:sugar O-acyltransferase (sialic acid O-acetyltransferase NeuD family)
MKNLLIIGARGFGREIYDLATQCTGYNIEYVIKGFLDDNKEALVGFLNYPNIIGSLEDYSIQKNDVFICALGAVKWKKMYTEIILNKGGEFISLIHPTAIINTNAKIGKGAIIANNVTLSNDCLIEDFVSILGFVVLGHDAKIGKWSHISAFSFFGGYASAANEVTVHTRASIMPHVKIDEGATVGASSLVIKNVKPKTTVFGIPATRLKF